MNTLKAEKRDLNNKAKRLRREGYVTGSIFGKDIEGSIPIQMNELEVNALLREVWEGAEITLEYDGKQIPVIIKEIQHNFLQHQFMEVDFQTIPKTE